MSLGFWSNASPRGKRIITIVLVFIVSVIFTAVATLTPMSQQDAIATSTDLNQTENALIENQVLLQFLFGNNLMLTLIMFIPFIGPILAFYFFYNTAIAFEALGIANNINPAGLFFTTFLTPVAWLEFLAYSTAIAGSIWLSLRILQGKTRHEVVNTAKFVSICAVVLLISAVIEAVLVYATA